MSAIVLSDAIALLAGSSATGSDDARAMKCSTPHSAPRSWPLPTPIGAASSSIARANSHDQKRPDLDPLPPPEPPRRIPLPPAEPSLLTSRGFLPWRLWDTGPGVRRTLRHGPASETLHKPGHGIGAVDRSLAPPIAA